MIGRGIAHLAIVFIPFALYLVVLPHIYGFSTLGDPLQLLTVASLFVLATSFMGQAVGAWFRRPETPSLIFLGTSLPLLFVTGFVWPREGIPKLVQAVGAIFPSSSRSTASCASTRWARACGRWHSTGGTLDPFNRLFRACRGVGGSRQAEEVCTMLSRRPSPGSLVLVGAGVGGSVFLRASRRHPSSGVVRTTESVSRPRSAASLSPSRSSLAPACGRETRRRALSDRVDRRRGSGPRAARRRDRRP